MENRKQEAEPSEAERPANCRLIRYGTLSTVGSVGWTVHAALGIFNEILRLRKVRSQT